MERGTYFAAKALLEVRQAGYQLISVGYRYKPTKTLPAQQKVAWGFVEWLDTIGKLYKKETAVDDGTLVNENDREKELNQAFQFIEDEVFTKVAAGSYVVDEIGYGEEKGKTYDFDLILTKEGSEAGAYYPYVLKNGEKITGQLVENTDSYIKFKYDDAYTLEYYPNGTTRGGKAYRECFVWNILETIRKTDDVKLVYHVALPGPEAVLDSDPGETTYGDYDADGSNQHAGLKTNHTAVLYPGGKEFPEPTVEYTVVKKTLIKRWADNENTLGTRPDSITVQLQRKATKDGVDSDYVNVGNPVNLSAADDGTWSYTWDRLLKYYGNVKEAGNEIDYRVVEISAPAGYSGDGPVSFGSDSEKTITNELARSAARQDGAVTVTKTDGTAQISGATFELYDGEHVVRTYSGGSFEISTADDELADVLPEAGAAKALTLREKEAPLGYVKSDASFTVRITASEATDWNGDRTELVTTLTYAMEIEGESELTVPNPTVSPTPSPTPTPTPAPTATPTAAPTATPTAAPTATPTATPTPTPTATPEPTATPTATPTVAPTATSTVVPTGTPTVTLEPLSYTAEGSWRLTARKNIEGRDFQQGDRWTFRVTAEEGVPLPENTSLIITPTRGNYINLNFGTISYTQDDIGNTYVYTIREIGEVENVTNDTAKLVLVTVLDNGDGTLNIVANNTDNPTVFTNVYTEPEIPTTSVSVRKIWNDHNNSDGQRPEAVTVKLSNGMSVRLTAANNWSATVNDLPAEQDGEPIVYTWTEQSVPGYIQESVTVNGNETVFTNALWERPAPPELPEGETELPKVPGRALFEFDDYETPLGVELATNHVGDCFE